MPRIALTITAAAAALAAVVVGAGAALAALNPTAGCPRCRPPRP